MPNDTQPREQSELSPVSLLACPFCGGAAVMEETEVFGSVRKSAGCRTEGCQGYQSTTTFATHREAIQAWNTRTPLQSRFVWTDRKQRLAKALETMTDDWIETGQYCEQTVKDLRDVLREALQAND